MDFYQSIAYALYARMEDGAACAPLCDTAAYAKSVEKLGVDAVTVVGYP